MARKSAAALSIASRLPNNEPAPAPSDLTPAEQELWGEIVASKPAEWFGVDSAPILKEYVRAAAMCDALAGKVATAVDGDDGGLVKFFLDLRDKESRRAASLATKLRLTQQSRYGARSADRADHRASGKRPWQSGS
jgi:hypothetical protein